MINSEKKQETILDDYHYDTEAIAERAREMLRGHRQYQKLRSQLGKLNAIRDLAKISMIQAQLREIETAEMTRLTRLEEEQRKNVNSISTLLKSIDIDEFNRYQELMAGVTLLLDMMDTAFSDVNRLLERNKIGISMGNFPELQAARKVAWDMASDEQNKMPKYKNNLWAEESERLYQTLQKRCAVYRRKVERIETKIGKIEGKGETEK